MSENIKMLNAYKKAIEIINSCSIIEQIQYAKNYIELFNNKFGEFSNYNDLKNRLNNQMVKLKSVSNGNS